MKTVRDVTIMLIAGLAAACQSQSASLSFEPELKMQPGRFAGFDQTALGAGVTFDNDIYSATCYPLFAVTGEGETIDGPRISGTILLWLHRAHAVGRRVFVEPCEIEAPFEASSTHIAGHLNRSWFEATLIDAPTSTRIALRRLAINGWSEFSVPAFCGRRVAFWSLTAGGELSGHVADLIDPATNASASFGTIEVPGSDNGWGVAPAAWEGNCVAATFKNDAGAARVIRIGPILADEIHR